MPLLADEKYPTTVAGARHLIEAYEKMFAVVDSKLRAERERANEAEAAKFDLMAENNHRQRELRAEIRRLRKCIASFQRKFPNATVKIPAPGRLLGALLDDDSDADAASSSSEAEATLSDADDDDDLSIELGSEGSMGARATPRKKAKKAAPAAAKRGRGRPPKKDKAEPGAQAAKRKRGRPRKKTPADESESGLAVSLDDEARSSHELNTRSAIKRVAKKRRRAGADASGDDDGDDDGDAAAGTADSESIDGTDNVVGISDKARAYELTMFKVDWKSGSSTWEFEADLLRYGHNKLVNRFNKKFGDKPVRTLPKSEWPRSEPDNSFVPKAVVGIGKLAGEVVFKVHWNDTDAEEDTWERRTDLYVHGFEKMVRKFEKAWGDKPIADVATTEGEGADDEDGDDDDDATADEQGEAAEQPSASRTNITVNVRTPLGDDDIEDHETLSSSESSDVFSDESDDAEADDNDAESAASEDPKSKKLASLKRKLAIDAKSTLTDFMPREAGRGVGYKTKSARGVTPSRSSSGRRVKPVRRLRLSAKK